MIRIGWIQTEPLYGDPQANLRKIEETLLSGRADLWVLPELFSTGYLFGSRSEVERLAEPVPDGPTTRSLVRIASESGSAVVAGIAERGPDGRLFNSAVAIDASGVRACYRKIHLFDYEKEWFDPGDGPFPVVTMAGARVGLMICWDWRFPESARSLALGGAQVIAHPANLVLPYCQAAMVTRALENRVFTVTANRVGSEERAGLRLAFTGGSRIVTPDGSVLSEGPTMVPAVDAVTIDLSLADEKRVTSHNDLLADRRPRFYRMT
jgi:predicted amidohydrolase